jgi:hypothetical protein
VVAVSLPRQARMAGHCVLGRLTLGSWSPVFLSVELRKVAHTSLAWVERGEIPLWSCAIVECPTTSGTMLDQGHLLPEALPNHRDRDLFSLKRPRSQCTMKTQVSRQAVFKMLISFLLQTWKARVPCPSPARVGILCCPRKWK